MDVDFLSFAFFSFKQICLIVHYLYDGNMALLLYDTSERVCHAAELYACLPDHDFSVRHMDNIHKLLQNSHDVVFEHLCASVHTLVSWLALLRRNIAERFGKLFNLHHLHHLHLHRHSAEALSVSLHGFDVFDCLRNTFLYAER